VRLLPGLVLAASLAAAQTVAHDATHAGKAAPSALPLPFDLGGAFSLTDQYGRKRSEVDAEGRLQLVFSGYAKCESICTVALPQMASITKELASLGIPVAPVMITVDPARDTPEAMAPILAALHPDFVGLTGPERALAEVYKLFSIDHSLVFEDPSAGAVYAHGSLLYLLDGKCRVPHDCAVI